MRDQISTVNEMAAGIKRRIATMRADVDRIEKNMKELPRRASASGSTAGSASDSEKEEE